jgi:hypothetical protein
MSRLQSHQDSPQDKRSYYANASHGNIRADLTWDDNLANDAQNWANHLASIDDLEHSPDNSRPNEGENIQSYSGTNATADLKAAAVQWANEVVKYHGEITGQGDFEKYGHYSRNQSSRQECHLC